MGKPLPDINQQWTLFLDRDGVINEDNIHGYILNWNEFKFYDGVVEAMKIFAAKFGRIVLVTNQRGVGKGLMSKEDLFEIHTNMHKAFVDAGGRMDLMLYCDAVENNDACRKPNPGMAYKAKETFPEIDFSKSIMVGNTGSDMEFGRNIGAFTVYIHTREDKVPKPNTIDLQCDDLLDLANLVNDLQK